MPFEEPQLGNTNRDLEYSRRFWKNQPEGKLEVYKRLIEQATQDGTISVFADMAGLSESDKEKLSALRILAKEMGYEVGSFTLNRSTGTATATISKIK